MDEKKNRMNKFKKKTLIYLLIIAVLTPIGIFLPEIFKAGDAWGEWGVDTVKNMVGYAPKGMEKLSSISKPLMPDYTLKGFDKSLKDLSFSYIISAAVGIVLSFALIYGIFKVLKKNGTK